MTKFITKYFINLYQIYGRARKMTKMTMQLLFDIREIHRCLAVSFGQSRESLGNCRSKSQMIDLIMTHLKVVDSPINIHQATVDQMSTNDGVSGGSKKKYK